MKGCIEWTGYVDKTNGYGVRSINGKNVKAHRAAWISVHGHIPQGQYVLHRCDNRSCVNVEHLFLGTYADNNRDCREKGRHRWGDNSGTKHGLSKITEQTAIRIKMLRGVLSQEKVASAVGLCQANVHDIMVGKGWKHVTAQTRYKF